jgi:hypothetical protein
VRTRFLCDAFHARWSPGENRPRGNAGDPINRPHNRPPKWHIERSLHKRAGEQDPSGTRPISGLMSVNHCCSTIYLSDTEFQIVNSKFQIVDSKLQIVDSKLQNTDSKLQNIDSKLQNTDRKLQNTDSKLQNVDSKLQNTDRKLQNTDRKLQNTDSKLQNIDSKLQIVDRKLAVHAKMADRDRHQGSVEAERSSPTPYPRGLRVTARSRLTQTKS